MSTATFVENLTTILTEEEVAERARTLAQKHGEFRRWKEEAKNIRGELKKQESKFAIEADALAEAVSTKTEVRPVECFESFNIARRLVEIIRKDTGECIRTRPMTGPELASAAQLHLPSDDRGNDDDDDDRHGDKRPH